MYVTSFDNIKIFYAKSLAKGSDETLLFIHGGFHGNHTLLKGIMTRFTRRYNIIAPDLRGRGDSDFPDEIGKTMLEDYAKDLYEIAKKENLKKVVVIGISFGGLVALKFYSMFCNKIKIQKIILISSAHKLTDLRKRTRITGVFYTATANALSFLVAPMKEKRKNNIDYSKIRGKLFDIRYGLSTLKNNSLKTLALRTKILNASRDYEISKEDLKKIKVPLLIIYGNRDFFFPFQVQKELAEYVRHAKIRVMNNCGHNLYIKKADETASIISKFLD